MKPVKTPEQIAEMINGGAVLMVGGFIMCGRANSILDALHKKGVKNLTIISNDTEIEELPIVRLIKNGQVSKFIGSYIGLNPVLGQKMNSGEIKVELVPQGTFAERIRAKGAGLGGVLTPTGIGAEIEKGKEKLIVDGKEYLLEKPLGADFAIVKAAVCDRYGNAFMPKSSKNFSMVMAMAADYTILETDKIVEPGELDPEKVTLPGVFVKDIVLSRGSIY